MSTSQQVERSSYESGRFRGDLPARTYRFAVDILRLFESIPSSPKAWVLGRQLLRSGTSVGANIHEASQALTDKEFVQRCSVARKEACEAAYWLDLCVEAGLLDRVAIQPARNEADELVRILSSIVKRCQLSSKGFRRSNRVGHQDFQEVES